MRLRTLAATTAGCSPANRKSVARKFLHFNLAVSGVIWVPIPPPPAPPPDPPAPPAALFVEVRVGRVTGGADGADDTIGPTGLCGNEMLLVEMLGDIVGRSDIDVGCMECESMPAWATDETPVDWVDGMVLVMVVPTLKIWYCPLSVFTNRWPAWPVGMPCPGLKFCKVCSGTVIWAPGWPGLRPGWLITILWPAPGGICVVLGLGPMPGPWTRIPPAPDWLISMVLLTMVCWRPTPCIVMMLPPPPGWPGLKKINFNISFKIFYHQMTFSTGTIFNSSLNESTIKLFSTIGSIFWKLHFYVIVFKLMLTLLFQPSKHELCQKFRGRGWWVKEHIGEGWKNET